MSKFRGIRIADSNDKAIEKGRKKVKTYDGKPKKQSYSNRVNELLNIALELETNQK